MSMCEQTSIMAYIRVSQTSTPALLHPRLCYAIARSIQISSISDTKNTQTSYKPIMKLLLVIWGRGVYTALLPITRSVSSSIVLIHRRQRSLCRPKCQGANAPCFQTSSPLDRRKGSFHGAVGFEANHKIRNCR